MLKMNLSPEKVKKNFFVYLITDPLTTEILYVGVDKLMDILTFRTLTRNPKFFHHREYTVEIISEHTNVLEAREQQIKTINEKFGMKTPPLNLTQGLSCHMLILCEQTGLTYRTAAEACRALNIQSSQLSNHLKGKAGHKTVKGLTFRYVEHRPARNE